MQNSSIRTDLRVILAGSIIFWIGVPWPVASDYFGADNDAERIAVVDDQRIEIAIAFGLLGLGTAIAGLGLWMLTRDIVSMEAARGPRRGTAVKVAGWLSLLSVLAGVMRLLTALLATPEFFVDNDLDLIGLFAMFIGTAVVLIILGVLAWSGPPPKWSAVVLIVGGVLGVVTLLPLFWYLALIVFAIANLAVMRRGDASPQPATEPLPSD